MQHVSIKMGSIENPSELLCQQVFVCTPETAFAHNPIRVTALIQPHDSQNEPKLCAPRRSNCKTCMYLCICRLEPVCQWGATSGRSEGGGGGIRTQPQAAAVCHVLEGGLALLAAQEAPEAPVRPVAHPGAARQQQ